MIVFISISKIMVLNSLLALNTFTYPNVYNLQETAFEFESHIPTWYTYVCDFADVL